MIFTQPAKLSATMAIALALAASPAAAQGFTLGIGASPAPAKIDTVIVPVHSLVTDTSDGKQTVKVTPTEAVRLKPDQVVVLWHDTTAAPPRGTT